MLGSAADGGGDYRPRLHRVALILHGCNAVNEKMSSPSRGNGRWRSEWVHLRCIIIYLSFARQVRSHQKGSIKQICISHAHTPKSSNFGLPKASNATKHMWNRRASPMNELKSNSHPRFTFDFQPEMLGMLLARVYFPSLIDGIPKS